MEADREKTDDQVRGLTALKRLDPDGTAHGAFTNFINDCPRGEAQKLAKGLIKAANAPGIKSPVGYIIHHVKEGTAMSIAKARTGAPRESGVEPWRANFELVGDGEWRGQDEHPWYEPSEGLQANITRCRTWRASERSAGSGAYSASPADPRRDSHFWQDERHRTPDRLEERHRRYSRR